VPFQFASVPFVNSRRMSSIFGVFLLVGVSATAVIPGTVASAATCVPVESSSGTDVVLTFNNTTNCDWVVPSGVTRIRVLLIGGGGGGGFDIGGGGGGGGFREVSNVTTTPGEVVTVTSGSGGNGDESQGTPCVGANGTSSSIVLSSGTLTAIGGGGGGGQDGGGSCATDGIAGGSGGGGGVGIQWPRVGGAGSYSTDGDATTFGNAGGDASPSSYYAGGGGGGADGVGGAGSSNGSGAVGGAGGTGKVSTITGANTAYAGGGAGGFFQSGTRGLGGTGGGGAGGTNAVAPSVGTNGLGGGGGGGGVQNGVYGQGARGGNGVVIVRYALADVRAPVRGSSTVAAGGTQITIAFDETLSNTSANLSSFTVRADGIALGLSSVSVSGSNVVLGVSSAVWQGAVVTVSYVDPTSGDDAAAIQDAAGNDVVSFSSVSVTNSSTVTTTTTTAAPVLEIVVSAPTSSTVPVGQTEIPIVSTPVVVQSTIAKSSPINVGKTATSSTTTTVATMGTVARAVPKISAVAAGQADVKIGDKVETATVQRIQNQLVVSAGALKATLGGLNSDGSSTALDDDGNVRLKSGDVIRIKLAGFKPGSVVEAWLFSTPALLGTAKVGVDGTVTGTFTIPKNASNGSHRIAVVAKTTDGKPATLTIGVMVGEWNSGSRITVWLIVLPIALAVGGAMALPATRRRRRMRSAGY
jgi:hypothetical protein